MNTSPSITIIGAGLAGCEAALQAAERGCRVVLHEMKPAAFSPAHTMEGLAELCAATHSAPTALQTDRPAQAELRLLDSRVIAAADETQVPAGGALAVDRNAFSAEITRAIEDHPLIELKRGEITEIPARWHRYHRYRPAYIRCPCNRGWQARRRRPAVFPRRYRPDC